MFKQYKNNLKIIAEILGWLLLALVNSFFFEYGWFAILWLILVIVRFLYSYYFMKANSSDIVTFPTQNDDYSKMTFITFGIMTSLFSIIGYFVFNINGYYSLAGISLGTIIFLLGYFKSPLGWISVKGYHLEVYGLQDAFDTRQLKEVILKNDRITIVNTSGHNESSYQLKLNLISAERIKNFMDKKIGQDVTVVNGVI